jgi:hypothetical protein
MGGILGCGVAWLSIRGVVQLAPAGLPRINEIAVDSRVLLFVVAVSLASGILFGLAPAVTLARKNLVQTLKNRGVARGSARSGSQTLVVIAEISICFTLLVGGGLLVRSLIRLSHVDPGFNPSNLPFKSRFRWKVIGAHRSYLFTKRSLLIWNRFRESWL